MYVGPLCLFSISFTFSDPFSLYLTSFFPCFSSMLYIIFIWICSFWEHLIIQYSFLMTFFLLFSSRVHSILILLLDFYFFIVVFLYFWFKVDLKKYISKCLCEDFLQFHMSYYSIFCFVVSYLEISYQQKIFYIFWFFIVVLNQCSFYFWSYLFLEQFLFQKHPLLAALPSFVRFHLWMLLLVVVVEWDWCVLFHFCFYRILYFLPLFSSFPLLPHF